MKLHLNNPKKFLNKAYLKEKVSRADIERFKSNFNTLLSKINENESEEHLKNLISDFLKDTWYKELYEINTKGRNDLVIHSGRQTKDSVGVIVEVKRPSNKSEMISEERPNNKAFHELILYYLRERIEHNNIDIRYLIATNIHEWFIFDEVWFEMNVFRNAKLRKDFDAWKLSGKDTKFFYESIAKPFLDEISEKIECTHFDLRNYQPFTITENKKDDSKLIALFKTLSPSHLLKQPFANDSNSLDTKFYVELLHIIGLEEKRDGGKKLIKRKANPSPGSILENTMMKLEDGDYLRYVNNLQNYGQGKDDQLLGVALELSITWVNRVLFLKLLEAQLYKYHKGNTAYRFLNSVLVSNYAELNNLFFQVLAEKISKRREHVKKKYQYVPYLNSSLFEKTELERQTIDIGSLEATLEIDILSSTVLKNEQGKKKNGSATTLHYLFDFLDSYDFTSEGSEEIQEENKNLINASVLGLIFEKINGYKDGSFFTPGFITMYMCRETIRKAVVTKFNVEYNIECEYFSDLKNFIGSRYKAKDILEFNKVINELKICDPAVGSGHFLVSALNELISIKAELGILADSQGQRLSGYEVKTENDELIVTFNDNTEIFEYSVTNNSVNRDVQRVQKTLFHEKELLIENCLFGVDINPNSVKICRLRLWIELLKNTYYREESNFTELETLPNIDINIKCGNSLINKFPLDSDITKAVKGDFTIEEYLNAIHSYHHAESKEEKHDLEDLLEKIKKGYSSEIYNTDPRIKRLSLLRGQRSKLENTAAVGDLFEKASAKDIETDLKRRAGVIEKLEIDIKEARSNKIYNHSFEWRFEFPEVLNSDGLYMGFDAIIGNPPYIFGGNEGITTNEKKYYKDNYISGSGKINLFTLFLEKAFSLLKDDAQFSYIIPNTFLRVTSYHATRKLLIDNYKINTIYDFGDSVFEDAVTTAIVISAEKRNVVKGHKIKILNGIKESVIDQNDIRELNYVIATNIDNEKKKVMDSLLKNTIPLGSISKEMIFGVVITKNRDEVVSDKYIENWKPFLEGRDIGSYYIKPIHNYLNYKPELLHRPRSKEIFEVPEKLLVQRITGGARPIKVAYDNMQLYNKESINNIILNEDCGYSYKFILCLMNSKLVNWFYTNQFTNESRLTVNLSKEYLSQIPIARTSLDDQKPFISLVEYILFLQRNEKQLNEYVPNSHIIQQIEEVMDAMVFELYFKADFQNKDLEIIKYVARDASQLKGVPEDGLVIHEFYQVLRSKTNEIRNNMKLMDIRLNELIMPIKTIY